VKPAIILLDLMMPGMTGWQFRREQLRDAEHAAIPVIYVSAFPFTLDTLQAGAIRAAAALQKPIRPAELLQTIRRITGSSPQGTPPPAGGTRKRSGGASGFDASPPPA
jgi:CheY-like chemotaxis protein